MVLSMLPSIDQIRRSFSWRFQSSISWRSTALASLPGHQDAANFLSYSSAFSCKFSLVVSVLHSFDQSQLCLQLDISISSSTSLFKWPPQCCKFLSNSSTFSCKFNSSSLVVSILQVLSKVSWAFNTISWISFSISLFKWPTRCCQVSILQKFWPNSAGPSLEYLE